MRLNFNMFIWRLYQQGIEWENSSTSQINKTSEKLVLKDSF